MSSLRLSLFGTFRAEIANQPLIFRSDKVRALLAYLAVEPGPHRREALATLLWSESPDQAARRSLASSLSRLRQSLAPLLVNDLALLEVDRQEVHLYLSPFHHQVDVLYFESLLQQCLRHPHDILVNCLPCMQRLEEAAAFYDGTFLAGFTLPDSEPFTEWQRFRQEKYEAQVVEVLHCLGEHALAQGEWARAEELAWQQLNLVPWQEEVHRLLMRLLMRRGQRSLALAQYERCCQAIKEAFGVEPEVATAELYQRLKKGAVLHNLPAPTTSLIGQQATLTQITALLRDPSCRLLTLVGLGGIGKTQVALEAAQRLVGHFLDGVYLISLASVEGYPVRTDDLLREVTLSTLQAVGVLMEEVKGSPQEVLRATLREKHLLLVLDNFEPLLGSASLLTEWLAQAPGMHLLVTSRERLNLQRETVFQVPMLTVPATSALLSEAALSALEAYSAVRLFEQSARRADPDFRLSLSNGSAVIQLCQAVGGMPLALELAAAWVCLLSCDQIVAQVVAQLQFLTTSHQDRPTRQRSVQAVFENSWTLLDKMEQRALAALSVFAGSFTQEIVVQVIAEPEENAQHWLPIIAKLLDKALLRRTSNGRLELHPLVRRHAAEKLAERAEKIQVLTRHSTCYAALLQVYISKGIQIHEVVQAIETEIENLRAGWRWAVETQHLSLVEQYLDGLITIGDRAFEQNINLTATMHYWWALDLFKSLQGKEGPSGKGLRRLSHLCERLGRALELSGQQEQALALYSDLEQYGRQIEQYSLVLRALIGQATLYVNLTAQRDPTRGYGLLTEALRLADETADLPAKAKILRNLMMLTAFSDPRQSIGYGEQALALTRHLALREQTAWVLNDLSLPYLMSGQLNFPLLEEACLLWREIGNLPMLADSLATLAYRQYLAGKYESGRRLAEEALQISQRIDNLWGQSWSLLALGLIHQAQGRVGSALATMRRSLALAEQVGYLTPLFLLQPYLGWYLACLRDLPQGLVLVRGAYARLAEVPSPMRGVIGGYLARLALRAGQMDQAHSLLASFAGEEVLNPMTRSALAMIEGELALAEGAYLLATTRLEEHLDLLRQGGASHYLPEALALKGRILRQQGHLPHARACLQEAEALATAMGNRWEQWNLLPVLGQVEAEMGLLAEAQGTHQRLQALTQHFATELAEDEALRVSFTDEDEL